MQTTPAPAPAVSASNASPNTGRSRRGRVRRWLGRLGTVLVLLLAASAVWGFLAPSPDVGHWRSAAGREAYRAAYADALAAAPAPTQGRVIPTRMGSVRAYGWTRPDRPDGARPVLLLPGIMSGSPMWAEHVAALAADRDVWALDAVGDAGLSTQSVPFARFADHAVWVEDALAGLGLDRVHVVGHSWGGAIASAVAVERPERVASLALLEPAFTLSYPPAEVFVWATVATLPVPQSWRDQALANIGGTTVEEVRSDDPAGRMINLASEHYSNSVPTPSPLTDEALRGLGMPVYVALADHASLAGGAGAAERARLIPGAQVQVWPNTTHSLPFQRGPALVERLDEWWVGVEAEQ